MPLRPELQPAFNAAQDERDKWLKAALKHKRPSGAHSDHAARDLERAKIAQNIMNRIEAIQPMSEAESAYTGPDAKAWERLEGATG